MMITMKLGLIAAGLLFIAGLIQWKMQSRRRQNEQYTLEYAVQVAEEERLQREERQRAELAEEKRQRGRVFQLDFLITHGSAFGGCAAVCPDGRLRKGVVPLDQVMMYGRQPSGREFTYYIEDQGIEVCAAEEPDCLVVRSKEQPFEIREEGLGRDQGVSARYAKIHKDILYYIILESRHEIAIKATRRC